MSDSTTFKSAETSQPQGLTSSHVERLSETTREDTPVSSPSAKLDAHWHRCYGFGKHFFTYVLAEPLYHAALPTATGPQLDAELQNSMTNFHYVDCLQKASAIAESADLSPPPPTRLGGHFAQLMEVIGLIALHDSAEAKRELVGAIRSSSSRGTGKERQFEGFPPSPPSTEAETLLYKRDGLTRRWSDVTSRTWATMRVDFTSTLGRVAKVSNRTQCGQIKLLPHGEQWSTWMAALLSARPPPKKLLGT